GQPTAAAGLPQLGEVRDAQNEHPGCWCAGTQYRQRIVQVAAELRHRGHQVFAASADVVRSDQDRDVVCFPGYRFPRLVGQLLDLSTASGVVGPVAGDGWVDLPDPSIVAVDGRAGAEGLGSAT